jgi:hypothetical protein
MYGNDGPDAWPSWPTSAKDETGDVVPAVITGNNIVNPTGGRMIMVAAAVDQTPTADTGWTQEVSAGSDLKLIIATKDFDSDGDATAIDIASGADLRNWILVGDAFRAGVLDIPISGPAPLPAIVCVALY